MEGGSIVHPMAYRSIWWHGQFNNHIFSLDFTVGVRNSTFETYFLLHTMAAEIRSLTMMKV